MLFIYIMFRRAEREAKELKSPHPARPTRGAQAVHTCKYARGSAEDGGGIY